MGFDIPKVTPKKTTVKSDAVQSAVKQATQAGTTNAAQKSNAAAASVYKASQQYLNTSFKGVSSTNYKAPDRGDGNSSTGISKNTDNQDTTPRNDGDIVIGGMPPAPKPIKKPTAADLGVVKNPSRDVTDIASLVPQADQSTVARLLFEQFSAVELAQILTPRTIDGIEQQYSIISNLSDIRRRYNSTRQLTVMDKLAPISGVFGIDINSKIPGDDYIINNNLDTEYSYIDENDNLVTVEKGYIYIDTNGDLVIEFDNITDDELIQVQIDTNGTIYEVTN